jgi:hypothetical protein
VGGDGRRRQIGGGARVAGIDRLRGERRGVRIEAEDDLAAALLYERREPIREGRSDRNRVV